MKKAIVLSALITAILTVFALSLDSLYVPTGVSLADEILDNLENTLEVDLGAARWRSAHSDNFSGDSPSALTFAIDQAEVFEGFKSLLSDILVKETRRSPLSRREMNLLIYGSCKERQSENHSVTEDFDVRIYPTAEPDIIEIKYSYKSRNFTKYYKVLSNSTSDREFAQLAQK